MFWKSFKDRKCFIVCKNKIPTVKFDKAKTFGEIERYAEIGLILPKGMVVIDCDNLEDSKIIKRIIHNKKINCIIMKTERGMHFIFKNFDDVNSNLVGVITPIGIIVDVRSGNSNGYIIIKKAGIFRDIQFIGDKNNISKLPAFLRPLRLEKNNSDKWYEKIRKCNVGARNSNLTSFKGLLNFMDTKKIIKVLNIINDFVFTEKIPEKEMKSICNPAKIEKYKSKYKKEY